MSMKLAILADELAKQEWLSKPTGTAEVVSLSRSSTAMLAPTMLGANEFEKR